MPTSHGAKIIKVSAIHADAFHTKGDVLILKYAQDLYGIAKHAYNIISDRNPHLLENMPYIGQSLVVRNINEISPKSLIFLGVPELFEFDYTQIRQFGYNALRVVSADVPNAKIILTTLHGAGYGLDESEAFMSLLFGFKDYFLNFTETAVEEIVFVELNSTRSGRLKNLVRMVLPDGQLISAEGDGVAERRSTFANLYQSSQKPDRSKNSIFVAMPFANEMDDVYHYAISGAAHKCGFICERADMVHFTGEIIAWMRQRIEVADYVIADLTGANANVYLEIGYAWGCQKPTILLLKEGHEVKFDVQGHRYIKYSSIHELEKKLSETLKAMSA